MNDINANTFGHAPKKKMTAKGKIGGVVFSLALVALCACVWIWPDLEHGIDREGIHGRGYHKAAFWMSLLWNRPIATIAGILGALGIFGMFVDGKNKKNNAGAKTAASCEEPSHGFDFDALSAAAKSGDSAVDNNELWLAVFSLREWHFIAGGTVGKNDMHPYIGVIDGKPFVFAFTDWRKAGDYAKANNLTTGNGEANILSVPINGVVDWLLKMAEQGVFGVLFNAAGNGFYAPLSNLQAMREQIFKSESEENNQGQTRK